MYRGSDEEQPVLRLMRKVMAALLAVCMAVFPIAMPRAAALMGHSHDSASHSQHGPTNADVSARHDCDPVEHKPAAPHEGDEEGRSSCCGTTACHAFQISSLPALGVRLSSIGVVQVACDHQVPDVSSGRLDRPPRTVRARRGLPVEPARTGVPARSRARPSPNPTSSSRFPFSPPARDLAGPRPAQAALAGASGNQPAKRWRRP